MKTREEKLAHIRSECIRANPEIKELKNGCLINIWWMDKIEDRPNDPDETCEFTDRTMRDNGMGFRGIQIIEDNVCGEVEIIGRPIRLADVLLAIRKKVPYEDSYMVMLDGAFCTEEGDGMETMVRPIFKLVDVGKERRQSKPVIWNLLKDDTNLQDDPTVDFLFDILNTTK